MARTSTDWPITTPEQRARLAARHEPYWRSIFPGLHLGYRTGKWILRRSEFGHTVKKRIGLADDGDLDADGQTVLSFKQAVELCVETATPAAGGYTVQQAWDAYMADYEVRSGKDTRGMQGQYDRHIKPSMGVIKVDDLKADRIRRWLNDMARTEDSTRRRAKQATANKQLTKLKACLNFAYQHNRAGSAVEWDKVKPFKNVDAPRIRFITVGQVKALIKHAGDDFSPLIKAAVLTGARWSELRLLQVDNVYKDHIHISQSKSGKARDIPLSTEGRAFFKAACKGATDYVFTTAGDPWMKSMQHRRMQAVCQAAKIKPAISFHLLRHYYAGALVKEGVSLQIVAGLLGHSDSRTTEKHYAHLQPSTLAKAVQDHLPKLG